VDIYELVGENGSGKTTLMKMIEDYANGILYKCFRDRYDPIITFNFIYDFVNLFIINYQRREIIPVFNYSLRTIDILDVFIFLYS